METTFNCPCCSDNNWDMVSDYHYHNNSKLSGAPQNSLGANFLSIRLKILFDVWFPNKKEVVLTSVYCNTCGFKCYSPRPNETDLQAKYQYLSERENIGALANPTRRALRLDRRREVFLSKVIAKHHDLKSQKVLDVGGGDGRLLRPFLKKECYCSIVDFNPAPLPEIDRLGSTINDIKTKELFNIIICSHVLEHVTEPGKLLRDIRSRLSDNGVVYIEVPIQIWKGIPIKQDPVTHINFFTVESLRNALLLNGLCPLSIKYKFSPYDGKYKRVVWAVASATEIKTVANNVSSRDTKKLLHPTLLLKLQRSFENFCLTWIFNLPLTIRKKIHFFWQIRAWLRPARG